MSHQVEINAIGIFLSIFFLSLAVVLGIVKLVLGVSSMLWHGLDVAASPSIWIVIPILTLFCITVVQLTMGLHYGFHEPVSRPGLFGLVQNGSVERFGPVFFLLMLPLAWVQLKTLATLLRLNRKLLRPPQVALPAT